ncbi:hypothetical protein QN345_00080 [Cryobacterium sp. 10I1]|uniref:hypothetical protein n=1 Tax=unclassified Cryobacterium TaxID=2649013 RepID=UPI002AC9E5D5|nr:MULTISPECIES: hypothetical protein [unclassified Cryobacterium]MEB0286764.1 hypothetical protein [Cryobacterium sp. 10S3]MEB0303735.1 hypothetical protein [Cryobacterium sp. 10I1]WPX12686.1 hypothetical protein RHM57_13500 [Cryobacterium sp. 10S3]
MNKLTVRLISFLALLAAAGIAVALLLDGLIPAWMQDHALTAGVLSGTIGLPLTTLVALFLVDYFVDRAEAARRQPLIAFLVTAVTHDAWKILNYLVPRDPHIKENRVGAQMSAVRHAVVASDMFDIVQQDLEQSPSPFLPEGWTPFPPSPFVPGGSVPRAMHTEPRVVDALGRGTAALRQHMQQLSDAQGNVALLHFTHILEAECLQWVDFYLETARISGGSQPDQVQELDIYRRWTGAELLAGLLIHLGAIDVGEEQKKSWIKEPRSLDDFWAVSSRT